MLDKYEVAVYETKEGTKVGLFKNNDLKSVLFLYDKKSKWLDYKDAEFLPLSKEDLTSYIQSVCRINPNFDIVDSWVE